MTTLLKPEGSDVTLFTPDDIPRGDHQRREPPPRAWSAKRLGITLIGAAMLVTVALTSIPLAFAIERPGPWWNTLGTNDEFADCSPTPTGTSDTPLISIDGATTYPTTGALDLLTVCLDGNTAESPNWFSVVRAYLTPSEAVFPAEYLFPPEQTPEQRDQENAVAMVDSQNEAVAAALTYLGYDVSSGVVVREVSLGMPAEGILEAGDVITAVDDMPVTTISELRDLLQTTPPSTPVIVSFVRDGEVTTKPIGLVDSDGSQVMGILGQTTYSFPFTVTINLNDVGGPSAGMMFALGIIDKLTPDSLTGGKTIAGTGTIDASGNVGPIGGIRQKMFSARAADATYFLAPIDDCDEVVDHVPEGLTVFAVRTLDDAVTALHAIAGDDTTSMDALPTCR